MSATPDSTLANPDQRIADLERQLAASNAERDEALTREAALAEVLQVINSSPGDLAPVFDAMLEKALRLCEAEFGLLTRIEEKNFSAVALRGAPPAFAEAMRQPYKTTPGQAHHRLLEGADVVHIEDITAEDIYRSGDPARRALADFAGARTGLAVALHKADVAIGAIIIYRREVRPFTGKQISLLQNFAAQAVIAMENARLLIETREALEKQTATAEILRVISGSPTDLQPTFDAIVANATILSGAEAGGVFRFDGSLIHFVAHYGWSPEVVDAVLHEFPRPPGRHSTTARAILTREVAHIPDAAADPEYAAPTIQTGVLTMLSVPILRDGNPVGAITVTRREVAPFSQAQIDLLKTFADQAVIAIENVRLFNETREALEQQTATAEVLQVINSSPGDLTPVFDAILEKAHTLCGADHGTLAVAEGQKFLAVATRGLPDALGELVRQPFLPAHDFYQRLLAGESFVQIADLADARSASDRPIDRVAIDSGVRTLLIVPLRKDGGLLGGITAFRQEVRPFSEKQIALLQNFASQAVIAMENARLLTETRESLEQQTATADVLGVINSSPGDLTPVFDAMLEKAHTLCGAALGSLVLYDGENCRAVAARGYPSEYAALVRQGFPAHDVPGLNTLLRGETVHELDPGAFRAFSSIARSVTEVARIRTLLAVPLCKDGKLLGYISAQRQEARPFSEKEIALLENFAAQAVIAMENARLINETREALEQQTATAEVLQVINSSPGDLAPVFEAVVEKATRLCEATHGYLFTYDGERFHPGAEIGDSRYVEWTRQHGPFQPPANTALGRIRRGERLVHVADIRKDDSFDTVSAIRQVAEVSGARSVLTVALRRDEVLLGGLGVYRQEVRPFSDKQIALLENFAAQAVIAMENARLLTETREALEQQTATAEVLQVINSSPGDLAPVFDAILEKAHTSVAFPLVA
jgi:GAF domain-containing protein